MVYPKYQNITCIGRCCKGAVAPCLENCSGLCCGPGLCWNITVCESKYVRSRIDYHLIINLCEKYGNMSVYMIKHISVFYF